MFFLPIPGICHKSQRYFCQYVRPRKKCTSECMFVLPIFPLLPDTSRVCVLFFKLAIMYHIFLGLSNLPAIPHIEIRCAICPIGRFFLIFYMDNPPWQILYKCDKLVPSPIPSPPWGFYVKRSKDFLFVFSLLWGFKLHNACFFELWVTQNKISEKVRFLPWDWKKIIVFF